MSDDKKPSAGPQINPSELTAAFSGPAVLSNRFVVTTGPHGVRLAFLEQNGPEAPPIFRSSVALTFQDSISLYKLLQTLLQDAEKAIEQSMTGR